MTAAHAKSPPAFAIAIESDSGHAPAVGEQDGQTNAETLGETLGARKRIVVGSC
jgi:hypothetical protein